MLKRQVLGILLLISGIVLCANYEFLYDDALSDLILRDFKNRYQGVTIFVQDGHRAVTESVLNGFKAIGINFNVNPKDKKKILPIVVVLAGINPLKKMIRWKAKGKIKKLVVGPNTVGSPLSHDGIIFSKEVDLFLAPGEWTYKTYKNYALLKNRDHVQMWYAGVNEDFWKPDDVQKDRNVLVYWKTEPKSFCDNVCALLCAYNWNPTVIQYGSYDKNFYKKLLEKSQFSVFLSKNESQGIALAESWSMDVPTLVWDPLESHTYLGCTYEKASAAPYLNDCVGVRWNTLEELENILRNQDLTAFQPREWVLRNMTDRISALQLLKIMAGYS